MNDQGGQTIVVAGGTGDLGGRILTALSRRGAQVRALVRVDTTERRLAAVRAAGAIPVPVEFADAAALAAACSGAACVVSALNGLEPTIIGVQKMLLNAAVAAGVSRFMPSDFSLDFTRTRPGDNRNMDLRRAFAQQLDRAPIRATSVLNGAFADLLTGQAPIVLHGRHRILYWGDADQPLDFTTKDDVAHFAADAALDEAAPRWLRIAGDSVSPRELATTMTELSGRQYRLLRAGGIGLLGVVIAVAKALTPRSDTPFPAWQGMQYLRDMASGRGQLTPLDNHRYGKNDWTRARDVLATTV